MLTASVVVSLALLACSSQPRQNSEEKVATVLEDMELRGTGNKIERIRDYQVDSWRYIDEYNLIIEAGFKDYYLVSLHTPCHDLRGALTIGFTSTAGSLDKFEEILVRGPAGRTERCHISDIVKLEPIPEGEPTPE